MLHDNGLRPSECKPDVEMAIAGSPAWKDEGPGDGGAGPMVVEQLAATVVSGRILNVTSRFTKFLVGRKEEIGMGLW